MELVATVEPVEIRGVVGVDALGRLTPDRLADELARADALFFPCSVEAFGYPLAEARLNRIPVIAPASPHSYEIGGDAAVAYAVGDEDSLAEALYDASRRVLPPLAVNPFDPDPYFRSILELS